MRKPLLACSVIAATGIVVADHSVQMQNFCGFGTATLDHSPSILLATGSTVYTNETVEAVAFLNNGFCGPNGGNCTSVDLHLGNFINDEGKNISGVIIDLVPTHVFSVAVQFSYIGGQCNGAGVSCLTKDCVNAMRDPPAPSGLVVCPDSNSNILVTFCPESAAASGLSSLASSILSITSATSSASVVSVPSKSHSSTNIGAIIGGSIGGAAAALVIVPVVLLYLRRRPKRPRKADMDIASIDGDEPKPLERTPSLREPEPPVDAPVPRPPIMRLTSKSTEPPASRVTNPGPLQDPVNGQQEPLPTQLRLSDALTREGNSQINIDRIVETLANRFGWSVPPTSASSGPDELPSYV